MKKIYKYLFVSSVICLAAVVYAKPADPQQKYKLGMDLFENQHYEEAAKAFQEAYDAKPSWKILFNIGQSQAAAKSYGLALIAFGEYLAQGGDEISEERQETVLKEVERLKALTGQLQINGPDGAFLTIDDQPRGTLPLPGYVYVPAGTEHKVVVKLGDDILIERKVYLSGGQKMNIDVQGDVEESSPEDVSSSASPASPSSSNNLRLAGWITVGVGAAVMAGGGVTGILAIRKNKQLGDACSDGVCVSSADIAMESTRDKYAFATDILLPLGGVIIAGGISLLIINKVKSKKESLATSNRLHLLPTASQRQIGLFLHGTF